jgi:glycosyltransferase involved in cell wall biosynthesis
MSKLKVSFCIPVYNTENALTRCLKSIIKCGLRPHEYEIIIVNDGDSKQDCCENIIKQFKKAFPDISFKYGKHLSNLGLLETRRTAVDMAIGKYICIVDSDDFIKEDSIKKIFDKCDKVDYDIIQADYEVITSDTSKEYNHPLSMTVEKTNSLLKHLLLGEFMTGFLWGKLIKTSIYKKAFEVLPNVHLNYAEDLVQLVFITKSSHSFKCVSDKLMYYYDKVTNCNSITTDKTIETVSAEIDDYKRVLNILAPDNFKDDDLKEKIKLIHLSHITSIYKLMKSFPENEEITNKFICVFGEDMYNKLGIIKTK